MLASIIQEALILVGDPSQVRYENEELYNALALCLFQSWENYPSRFIDEDFNKIEVPKKIHLQSSTKITGEYYIQPTDWTMYLCLVANGDAFPTARGLIEIVGTTIWQRWNLPRNINIDAIAYFIAHKLLAHDNTDDEFDAKRSETYYAKYKELI